MKTNVFLFFLLLFTTQVGFSQTYSTYSTNSTYVNGYNKNNGTTVQGYERTNRNNTNADNYSTTGNVNPYTQTQGTRAADYSSQSYNYGQGKTIQEGPRGGQYYTNDNGRKVYVPKRD